MIRLILSLAALGLMQSSVVLSQDIDAAQITDIGIGPAVLQSSVKHVGINLGDSTYYDAGQLTKNLVFRNPGFEGQIYQSTIRCASGTVSSCVDDDGVSAWPEGFWKGASFEIFYGAAEGRRGTIASYRAAGSGHGGTFLFSDPDKSPSHGDYMIVRKTFPGDAAVGWWPTTTGKGAITTNLSDLPPETTGRQTVAVSAPAAGDSATLAAYFDSHAGKSFLLLNGTFQLSFKAKGTGGSNSIAVALRRNGLATYLNETVHLTSEWATYQLSFAANEAGSSPQESVALQFTTNGQDSFLLDDVSLRQTNSDPSNTTAFRDPVLHALQALQPGSLRFWAGQSGDTLDNLIADPSGRQRSGYLAWYSKQEDISYGLHEFLELSAATGAEPWIVIPSTFRVEDGANLIEYLAGGSGTPYGRKRAARGRAAPWSQAFPKIHLEFGNEAWNGQFKGGTIEYPAPYGRRARKIFAAMRANPAYVSSKFDLILGGQAVSPDRNQQIQNNCDNNDSFAIAPYLMNTVDSFANTEELYGSTFAEPEAYFSPQGNAEGVAGGLIAMNQSAIRKSSHPVPLIVYELNLSTLSGSITQSALDSYVSSLGAGLAVADTMLQSMSHGVNLQNLWNLSQFNFVRPDRKTANLWGAVIDMGVTDRRRPQYLAMQLINEAIGKNSTMIQTSHSGSNPAWNQPLVNTVQLPQAHYLQSFAFSGEGRYSLIVFNLNRSASLPVTFSGMNAPGGTVAVNTLTSASPSDTNETSETVRVFHRVASNFDATSALALPPFSMTTFTWGSGQ